MKFIYLTVIGTLFFSTASFASGAASCDLDLKVEEASLTVHVVGGLVYSRQIKGTVTKAEKGEGRNDIDCAATYLNKTVSLPLILKASEKKAAAKLGNIAEGTTVKVNYRAMDGETPWGVLEGKDYWLNVQP